MTEEERYAIVEKVINQLRDYPSDDDPYFITREQAADHIVTAWSAEVDSNSSTV